MLQCRVQPRTLDSRCRPGRGHLQQCQIPLVELAGPQRPYVQDSDEPALDDQGHSQERADPLFPQDWVHDVGVVDVGDKDGHSLGGDPPGEPPADRNPHPLLHFLLDSLGRTSYQLLGLLVVEQDGHRIHVHGLLDAHQQLVQELLQPQL